MKTVRNCRLRTKSKFTLYLAIIATCTTGFAEPLPRVTLSVSEQLELEQRIMWQLRWQRESNGDQLRADLARLFATSPSLVTYSLYLRELSLSDERPTQADVNFARMSESLSRDFSKEAGYRPVFDGINVSDNGKLGRRATGKGPTVFKGVSDVIGWSWVGAPLSDLQRDSSPEEVKYALPMVGISVAMLAPVYEMAKRQRKNVTVKLGELQLSGAAGDASGLHAEIEMDLPVYAITPTGLIPGRFIRSAFMGDPCSDAHSNAEFGFNRPVESPVLGVFATAVPIDPKRANISIEKNAWFDVKAGSFVRIASYRVDLDGNDSTDLYGVHRVDSELDWDFLSNVARDAPPRIVPAAGWYGADIDFIEANVDGRWIRLSAYQLGSCT